MATYLFQFFVFFTLLLPQVTDANTVLPRLSVKVPMFTQTTDYTCGPASSMSVLRYFGKGKGNSEMGLARLMDTTTETGTRFWNLARILNERGLKAEVKIGATVADLRASLQKKHPVILNIDDEGGHYVVLAGIDSKYVYFMDPWYEFDDYRKWEILRFESQWYDSHDGVRYDHLGIFISNQ